MSEDPVRESSSDHVDANREFWSQTSADWIEPGRRSWQRQEITWGIWDVPEADIHALGELDRLKGQHVVELGCGTAYFSAWMAKHGAQPVGVDVTPAQLATARQMQEEFGIAFPLIEASAEAVPLESASFDVAISEYGASIWCDPYRWIPEAARLLKPGGTLVFLRNSTLSILCLGASGTIQTALKRDYADLYRVEWDDDPGVEFHLPTGPMLRCLRENGFDLEDLIEVYPPQNAVETRFTYMNLDWAKRWPSEEIWRVRKSR